MPNPSIVAFGNFDLYGARSWVIRTGLAEVGYTIVLCRTEVPGLIGKYRDLWRRWQAFQNDASAIYVVFLGHYLMPLAWWLGKRAGIPVIFDAFLSLHDTEVYDRKRVSRFSPKAWILWFTDWLGCALADVVLLETEEHKEYFVKKYGVDPKKILVLPIGCRTDLCVPQSQSTKDVAHSFTVEFHGTYIPLQGIDVILGAAKELQERGENVAFTLIGAGQTFKAMSALALGWNVRNVTFISSVPMENIPAHIQCADVCLGIFGTTAKAGRVIPNKAYEVLACGRPLITGDTAAARRVFRDRENALLSTPGDPHALAENILLLARDTALRETIAVGGLALSRARFTPGRITAPLADWLRECP